MLARFSRWLLPGGADNPLLAYESLAARPGSRRSFRFQLLALVIALIGGALLVYNATDLGSQSQSTSALLWQSLYFPVLALQLCMAVAALLLGAGVFQPRRQSQAWDHLRVTEAGIGLVLRARWLGIMWRLRAPIAAVLLLRLMLLAGMLHELTAFGSGYATMLGAEANPPSPDWRVSLLSVAASWTASLTLPLVMTAAWTALGMCLGLALRERLFAALALIMLMIASVGLVGGSSYALAQILHGQLRLPPLASSLLFLGYSTVGDWGLSLAQLESLGALWQHSSSGVLGGFALAGLALGLAWALDGLLWLAEHLAERRA